jgi:lipid-A-disaccharide synthase
LKRIFFVAGEASGDTHGASLIRALRAADPELVFEGLGGEAMARAGMALRHDLASDAIMGFTEVVKHFPAIRRLFHRTLAHIEAVRPAAVVLIDYPGFNIRLCRKLAGSGIPVVYYISPQVWAWKKNRLKTLARCVRKMLVIFPFEEELYRGAGLDCVFAGHPLMDHIAGYEPVRCFEGDPVIGVLPGSRAQEIERILPVMLAAAEKIRKTYPGAAFVTPCVSEKRAGRIRELAGAFPLEVVPGAMYDVLASARFCMVASGTATLETAIFGVPMVIGYRVSPLSYRLARILVRDLKFIGMVNILAGRGIVPEFIQDGADPARIVPAALQLIGDTPARETMKADLAAVREQLGGGGASENAAREILRLIEEEQNG